MKTFLRILSGGCFLLAVGLLVGDSHSSSIAFWGYSWFRIVILVAVSVSVVLSVVSFLSRRMQITVVAGGVLLIAFSGLLKGLDSLAVYLAGAGVIPGWTWLDRSFGANPYRPYQHGRGYNNHLGKEVIHRTNALGFRGGPVRDDARKILLLGDSVMYGINNPEEDTYAAVLEKLLGGKFQVLNGAWPGTSTFRQEQTLVRYLYSVPSGLEAVIVGYLENDPPDNLRVVSYGLHGMYLNKNVTRFDSSSLRELVYRDYVYPLFVSWEGLRILTLQVKAAWAKATGEAKPGRARCIPADEMAGPPYHESSADDFARGLDLAVSGLRRIAAMARLSGARTYVVYLPWGENSVYHFLKGTWKSTGHSVAYNRLKAESERDGYEFIDGLGAVAMHLKAKGIDPCQLPPEYYSWPGDFTHSSPVIVQVIASEIFRVLASHDSKGSKGPR